MYRRACVLYARAVVAAAAVNDAVYKVDVSTSRLPSVLLNNTINSVRISRCLVQGTKRDNSRCRTPPRPIGLSFGDEKRLMDASGLGGGDDGDLKNSSSSR